VVSVCSQKQFLFVHNLCMYKIVLIAECTDQMYIQGDSSCFTILISVSLTESVVVVSIFFSLQCLSEISSSPVMFNSSCLTYVLRASCEVDVL
jgi:hypothetical protein